MLVAYAAQAAAALDTATALREVSHRNETARDLLRLSTELANVASPDDVVLRIAAAVPTVVDCRDLGWRLRLHHLCSRAADGRRRTSDMAASASATWQGTLEEGSGTMETGTGLKGVFTRASRFADGAGTNPEELVGAAHAGCFSQYLALLLSKNGTPPDSIETTAKVSIQVGDDGPSINRIALTTVVAADLTAEQIIDFADQAKVGCPVSKALAGVAEITLQASKG